MTTEASQGGEFSWKEVEWRRVGRAGPFEVYISKYARWHKLRRCEDDGKTVLEFVITDREAADLREYLVPF